MSASKTKRLHIVILTGLSGAGKSVALNTFEDNGFFCIDNLPTTLIDKFIRLSNKTPNIARIALGVDIRERKFPENFSDTISSLRVKQNIEVFFLEATDDVLIKRFKETRRPHPLGYKDLKRALRTEGRLLAPIKKEADHVIDTSSLSPHELRKLIINSYLRKGSGEMKISLISFGYKYGLPSEVDLLFDVRFLPNPYFIQSLKALPGTTLKVRKFVLSKKETKQFLDHLYPLLNHLIPLYKEEGKSYLTIGIGCTGGMHRSPAISGEIQKYLKKRKLHVSLTHRDL